jgi:NAD(P)-dependent dehydrogenase (short-subunit alcohol dehydrogenase family)
MSTTVTPAPTPLNTRGWNQGRRALVIGTGAAVEAVAEGLQHSGAAVLVVGHTGLEAEAAVSSLLDRARTELGGEVTTLVFADKPGAAADATLQTLAQWQALTTINLDARFFCCAEFARRCIAAHQPGTILHLLPKSAEQAASGLAATASAAGGVLTLNMSLAVEWGRDNIRSNVLVTRLADSGVSAADPALPTLANLAAYYSSDYAAYITGACHGVDEV